ncbi:hypothetical protein ACWGRK_06725 [Saccharomonospora azurea]
MKMTTRVAGNLAGAGLVGCLVWSVVVQLAMPSWFAPAIPAQASRLVHTMKEHAQAMSMAVEKSSRRISVPFLGTLELPPSDQLAFLGGVVTLGVMGVVD